MDFTNYYHLLNELKQAPYKVYVDLDGTLVDFVGQTKKHTGHTPDDLQAQGGDPKMWGEIKKHGIDFWKNMPWIDGSKKVWNIVKKYKAQVLTAPSRSIEECKPGKEAWVKNNLGGQVTVLFSRASEKCNHADANSILIDDLEKNIVAWRAKGGIGILFKTPEQTIKELEKLGIK